MRTKMRTKNIRNRPTGGTTRKLCATGILACGMLLPLLGLQAGTAVAGGGVLEHHADLTAFFEAAGGVEELVQEDFDGGPTANDESRVCDQPVNHQSGTAATNIVNLCFRSGDLVEGFSVRPQTNPVLQIMGPDNHAASTKLLGTFPGPESVFLDFHDSPTAIAIDVYQTAGPGTVTVEVFAAEGYLLETFVVDPPSQAEPALVAFTSPVTVGRVGLQTTNPGVAESVGNLYFGGGPGQLAVDDGSLDFGHVAVGDTTSRTLTFSNAGHLGIDMQAFPGLPAPFVVDDDACAGVTLDRGEECTVEIGFEPTHQGEFAESFPIEATWAVNEAVAVSLAGSAFAPTLSVAPQRWDFGDASVGQATAPAAVRLANFFPTTQTVTGLDMAGQDFIAAGGDCPTTPFDLQAGESCEVLVSFEPSDTQARAGAFLVSAGSQSHGVHVSGRGVAGALEVNPESLDFGAVTVGDNASLTFEIGNPGQADLAVNAIGMPPAPFSLSGDGDCPEPPFVLAAGESCSVVVLFEPADAQSYTGSVDVESDAGDATVTLSGEGTEAPQPGAGVAATLAFGELEVGDTGQIELLLESTGSAPLTVTDVQGPDAPFSRSPGAPGETPCDPVPFDLAPGEVCAWTIGFAPTEVGSFSDELVIVSNAGTSPDSVSITGSAAEGDEPPPPPPPPPPPGEPLPIPTLHWIGMLLMMLLFGVVGTGILTRRQV